MKLLRSLTYDGGGDNELGDGSRARDTVNKTLTHVARVADATLVRLESKF